MVRYKVRHVYILTLGRQRADKFKASLGCIVTL